MKIISDNINYSKKYLINSTLWDKIHLDELPEDIQPLVKKIFNNNEIFISDIKANDLWKYLFITEYSEFSQFDLLNEFSFNQHKLPSGILCIAGAGKKFHGFKNREWSALDGNLHLSAYFSPNKEIENFNTGLMVIPAVSVLETINNLEKLNHKAAIKWVNDILIGNAKVAGVLANTKVQGSICTDVIFGIGINVEKKPDIEPNMFVPETACLIDFIDNKNEFILSKVFHLLIERLALNYNLLYTGNYFNILEIYKDNSMVTGKDVEIYSDEQDKINIKLFEGKAERIGNNLELYLMGVAIPVTNGRLALKYDNKSINFYFPK